MNEPTDGTPDALRRLGRVAGALPPAPTTAKSHHGKYLDLPGLLAHVNPYLAAEDLLAVAELTSSGPSVSCRYLFIGPLDSYATPWLELPAAGTPQAVGAACTYARRYQLSAAVGVGVGEDVDAAPAPKRKRAQNRTGVPPAKSETEQTFAPAPAAANVRDLQIRFGQLGIKARDERLAICCSATGRELESSKDLTPAELHQCLKYLEHYSSGGSSSSEPDA